jgi:hypothetical protein
VSSQGVAAAGDTRTLLSDGRWLALGLTTAIEPAHAGPPVEAFPPLQTPRQWHSASVLPDGRVLVLGGQTMDGRFVNGVELVDPYGRTSQVIELSGWVPRAGHTATLLNERELLIAGGVGANGAGTDLSILDLKSLAVRSVGMLPSSSAYHSATLEADGRVLLSGGSDRQRRRDASRILVDPVTGVASDTTTQGPADEILYLASSTPLDGAVDVPVDHRFTFRFSVPVHVDATLSSLVSLTGSSGDLGMIVIPAENGRLLFVTPLAPLTHGRDYTLKLTNLRDASGSQESADVVVRFSTAKRAEKRESVQTTDDEMWDPIQLGQYRAWRANRPDSPWQSLPSLEAEPGVTALAGQTLRMNGAPLPGVTLEIDGRRTTSDTSGRFLLRLPASAAGWKELWIDGRSANRPQTTYGTFEAAVRITARVTTRLPFTIWMPKIDTAHQVTLPSPTDREVVVTTPTIPGLELRIPPNTVIRDRDGQAIREVSITAIPVDRTPFPLPVDTDVPIYFTIQPGGATVQVRGYGSGYANGARLIYPNYRQEPPGKRINFWHYDPEAGRG